MIQLANKKSPGTKEVSHELRVFLCKKADPYEFCGCDYAESIIIDHNYP
jgi:hypothetical protein